MDKVLIDYNFREVDQLDGKDLIDGEKLIVKWPVGGVTTEIVAIERSVHGFGVRAYKVSRAFITVGYNGIETKVYLADYENLLCERI